MVGVKDSEWVALREDDGRAYLLQKKVGEIKIKGLGRFDANQLLDGFSVGDRIKVGRKSPEKQKRKEIERKMQGRP